MKWKETF